jgi:hypothetical protein
MLVISVHRGQQSGILEIALLPEKSFITVWIDGLDTALQVTGSVWRLMSRVQTLTGTSLRNVIQTLVALVVAPLLTAASPIATGGAVAGGMVAALPVLASVLSVLTHREAGSLAVVTMLRGMLAGMVGFVAFYEVVALLSTHASLTPTFAAATASALVVQLSMAGRRGVSPESNTR